VGAVNERICEVARDVIAELGQPELLERLEQALDARGLTGKKVPRKSKRRRWSFYPLEELGAAICAKAKAEKITHDKLLTRILAEHFGVSP
jgi:hypothetical protein